MKSNFFPTEERNFFEHATEREMIEYLKENTVFVGTERWILANCSNEVLEALFKQQPLASANEQTLVEGRDEKMLRAYILRYPLSQQAKELMVKLDKVDAIQQYNKTYGKSKEGE